VLRDTTTSAAGALDTDELVICRGGYEAAAHFGRPSGGHPVLFDLEQLP
jgi:hypothetical protein